MAAYGVGGLGFVAAFLAAGASSVPRRFAAHLAEWQPLAVVGSAFGAIVLLASLLLVARVVARLRASA